MGAVGMLVRSEIRRRWPGLAVIAILVAFAGTATLGAAAGASRTASSFDRFLESTRNHDVLVFAEDVQPRDVDALRSLPGVDGVGYARQLALIRPDGEFLAVGGSLDDALLREVDRLRIVAGRDADPAVPEEVVIGEALARSANLSPGDVVPVQSFSQQQVDGNDLMAPQGPEVELHVVGVSRSAIDLSLQGGEGGVLLLPRAFVDEYGSKIGNFSGESGAVLMVRLADGEAGVDRFLDQLGTVMGDRGFDVDPSALTIGGIQESIDLLAVGVLVFGAIAGTAALIALGLIISRQVAILSVAHTAVRELGMPARLRSAALAGPVVIAIVAGSIGAVLGAFAASPLVPFGVARLAEPDPGWHFDVAVLVLGAVVFASVLTLIAVIAASLAARRPAIATGVGRPSTVARWLEPIGLAPPVNIGVGMALEPGRGRTAVPVRSSLLGVAVAVLGVAAVTVFSASLHRFADSPRAYGADWNARVTSASGEVPDQPCDELDSPVVEQSGLDALANACSLSITLDGRAVGAVGLRPVFGSIEPTVLEGQAPRGVDEIALGSETLAALRKGVGDRVSGQTPAGSFDLRIVGRVVVPSYNDAQAVADGAVFTGDGLRRLYNSGNVSGGRALLVRFASGADGAAARERISQLDGLVVEPTPRPLEVERLEQADRLPLALGIFLPILGTVAVGYLLVTSVQRRRHDFAILKSLGFRRAQLQATVAVQATTVACVGLVLGLVPGVAAGGLLWRAAAGNVGVVAEVSVPILAITGIVVATIVLANVVAIVPALTAARTRSAELLRSE